MAKTVCQLHLEIIFEVILESLKDIRDICHHNQKIILSSLIDFYLENAILFISDLIASKVRQLIL